MRHPLVPALLVVLALVGYAVLGAVVAGASSAPAATADRSAENATVSGTVTDEDGRPVGDAYVLLEPAPAEHLREATAGDRSIAESLLRFGMADLEDVTAVRTDDDGRYHAEIPQGTYEVVAVTEDRAVSRLRRVSADGEATVDPTVDPDGVLRLTGGQVSVGPGNETTVTLQLENTDDDAVGSLAVEHGVLPDDWEIESVATEGRYDPAERAITWDTVAPGETVSVRLTLSVPEGAQPGRHSVRVSADAKTHFVEQTRGVRVRVEPPGWTPTPTHTAVPGGDDPAGSDGEHTEGDGTASDAPFDTDTSAPGPGVGLAGLALAALAIGMARRTDGR